MPSSSLLDEIAWNPSFHHHQVILSGNVSESSLRGTTQSALFYIEDYYRFHLGKKFESLHPMVLHVIREAIQNSQQHRLRCDSPIVYCLFIGEKGVCHGFHDGGEYFKRDEIKRIFETKTPLREFDQRVPSRRIGVRDYIYPYSDVIEVDTNAGVLYCAQSIEDFLV